MSSNTGVVRAYFAACEARDVSVVDRLFSPGFVSRAADGEAFGVAEQRASLAAFFDEFDDLTLEVHTMLESGDRVVTHYTHRAVVRRSGDPVAWDRIVIHRLVDGRIVEAVGDRRFCFPPLDEPYATALRDATTFIARRFPSVLAIAACGTIVRGTPHPASDLDLYAIHAEPWCQRLQRRFDGVPAEIFINPEFQVDRYLATESEDGRPITAHMLITGYPVFDPDGTLARLRAKATRTFDAGPTPLHDRVRPKYLIASLYEDATDVADSDPHTARLFANRAVETAGLILDRVVGVRGLFEWESTPRHLDPPN